MTSDPASARLLPDWAEFESLYVQGGVPNTFQVRQSPYVGVFVEQGGARLGARFAVDGAPINGGLVLNAVDVRNIVLSGVRYVEISTTARNLYTNFFGLAAEVVADVVAAGAEPGAALTAAIQRWENLLARRPIMSGETQAGLFGELWLLQRLARRSPVDAIDAWTGPLPQAHDFRIGDNELEVKTTSGNRRIHTINGAGQLEASPGCALYLLSLQLADAGAGGATLPDAVAAVEELLAGAPEASAKFRSLLDCVGYSADDAALYPKRYRLRSEAKLITVGPGVPRLTQAAILGLPSEFAPERIGRVSYEIDVEGLGASQDSGAFKAVIPSLAASE